jgi:hypothetical protein
MKSGEQERIKKIQRFGYMAIFVVLILFVILAISSCSKSSYLYKEGIYMPPKDEINKIKPK